MKISELKQPYRRMAEYLAEKNTYTRFKNKEILNDAFDWYQTNVIFWLDIADGDYPPITEEIKKHFPADFDFSGEEEVVNTNPFSFDGLSLNEISIRIFRKNFMDLELWEQSSVSEKFEKALHGVNLHKELFDAVNVPKEIKEYKMSLFDKENQRKIEDENLQKRIYTQLAKEGKFDQLPDTCEFSEPVELEVWDNELMEPVITNVLGKFKGLYVTEANLCWQYAKLPTPKIDFLQFKAGDVVEVETISVGYMYGYIREVESDKLLLSLGYMSDVLRTIRKEKIKSITKIK